MPPLRSRRPALTIAAIYMVVSLAWIYFSDSLVHRFVPPATMDTFQTWKGWGFVMVTSLLLFWLIRRAVVREQALIAQLRQERNLVENITQTSPVGIVVLDREGRVTFTNRAFQSITGLQSSDMLGQPFVNLSSTDKAGAELPATHDKLPFTRVISSGDTLFGEQHSMLQPDGGLIHLSINAAPMRSFDGKIIGLVATLDNITEQHRNALRIANLNRIYNVLAEISHCIQQRPTPEDLFHEACRIAVELGGFRMAWIGILNDESGLLEPVAVAGHNEGYAEAVAEGIGHPQQSQGPAGRAFRSDTHFWCNDIATEACMAPWRDQALARGFRSSAAFPLSLNDKVIGIYSLYAGNVDFFTNEELALLDEMAGDIGLALAFNEHERERVRTEAALRESEARYRNLFENQNAIMMLVDPDDLTIVDVNPTACHFYGKTRDQLAGTRLTQISQMPEPQIRDIVQGARMGDQRVFYSVHRRADGQCRDVEIYSGPVQVEGRLLLNSIIHDITDRRSAEDKLRLHSAVLQSIRDGVVITDLNQNILSVNPAFTAITGYRRQDLYDKRFDQLLVQFEDSPDLEEIWTTLRHRGHWQGEAWGRRSDGDTYPQWLSLNTVRDDEGRPINYVAIFADISELKEKEARLEHLAHYDPLTGLPNRSLAQLRMEHNLHQAQRRQCQTSMLFIDLDRFKNINDSLGHHVGDEVLVAVAKRIQHHVRGDDTLARFSGDEFLLILEPDTDPQRAAVIARHLLSILEQPFVIADRHDLYVGASIGISVYPSDGDTVPVLVRNAETAMYRAKDLGRNCFCFFTPDMNADALHTLELEAALRQAIDREELVLHYQPQLAQPGGRLCGCEALIRWQRTDSGLVSPGEFIPLAEQTGLIVPIGEWVIETACRQLRTWEDQGLTGLRVAVNVSARQFHSGQLDRTVARALQRYKVNPDQLEVELTESMLMEDADQAVNLLKELKRVGVRISLDDFGTGYSSLAYLSRFPIDALKIDGSFVAGLDTTGHQDAATIIAAIIDLAHRLGLRVVAEGVENQNQLDYLQSHGCDEMQGFFFSKPLPVSDFEALWQENRAFPSAPANKEESQRDL